MTPVALPGRDQQPRRRDRLLDREARLHGFGLLRCPRLWSEAIHRRFVFGFSSPPRAKGKARAAMNRRTPERFGLRRFVTALFSLPDRTLGEKLRPRRSSYSRAPQRPLPT